MINLLNQIIEEIDSSMTLFNESFSNETIFDKILSNSRFYKCNFENIVFDNVVFRKSEFSQCRFQNCQILGSDLTRIEQVDLSGSLFDNVQFS